MCRAGLESLPSSNAHIGDPWPASAGATGREAAGLPKGSWVSGVAALGPLLLPIGAWGPGVTPLPKVDFGRRVRQSPPVTSRELPDMYPALWRPGLGLRDDRGRKSSRSARQNSSALRRILWRTRSFKRHSVLSDNFPIGLVLSGKFPIGIPRNKFWAAHVAVHILCAGGFCAAAPHAQRC